jgi:AraC-like DNA-binding protein
VARIRIIDGLRNAVLNLSLLCCEQLNEGSVKIFVKYMVSLRCKMIVRDTLNKLDIPYASIDLGVIETLDDVEPQKIEQLRTELSYSSLELLDSKRSILIEKVKAVIIDMIHYSDELPATNYSDYISDKLHYDYTYLSNMFSEVKGITIQQFIILNKIERVKELLIYDQLNLTQIAQKLHYSSTAHLSNQFRKVTGLSPTFFKKMKKDKKDKRTNLEDL